MRFISRSETSSSQPSAPLEPHDPTNPHSEPQEVTGLGLEEASELLDWLEGRGIVSPKIEADATGHLTIRWQESEQN